MALIILSTIFTTINESLNRMMDCAKYKYLFLELIIIVFVSSSLNAQGLHFYGNKVPIEKRTSYTLFAKKQPVFSDYINLEFDLRISQGETFGYLLHLINPANNEAYSLTFYSNNQTCFLNFNTEGKVNHISIRFSNDSVISHWLPVKLRISFSTGESVLSIGDKQQMGGGLTNLQRQMQPVLSFGRREHLVDVPAFAIRNLKVSDKTQTFSFNLKESQGHEVHDNNGKVQGWVENPYWLINDSYHWNKVAAFTTPQCVGSKFNEKTQEIVFITPDSLFTYKADKRLIIKKPYANRMPVMMLLGTNFLNESTGEMYAYEINNLPIDSITIASLNLSNLTWKAVGKAFTSVQLHHHNGFWDGKRNRYLVFGGFGNRLYSNKFLSYNEMADRWDTLQFKGDMIPPRFFSSMACSRLNDRLFIYGGVGNESGDQSIGHNYYNDLYEVDLKDQLIKRYWSLPVDEKRVPSGQMILSEDEKSLYVIRYAEYIKSTDLQLYKMSVEDGSMEQLADSIPFASGSIASTVSLYYNSELKEFYCVTKEFDEHAKLVKTAIYMLSDPPVSKADMEFYVQATQKSNKWIWFLGFGGLLVCVSLGICCYNKKRKKAFASLVTAYAGKRVENNGMDMSLESSTISKFVSRRKVEANQIYVYGMFTVYNRDGRDVTHLFSKKLQHIFLYILLNSTEDGEGVNSSSLNDIFWPDKSEDKAKNLKGVTISNLRKALTELDGIKLVYEKGAFKIEINESVCFCDYNNLYSHLRKHPQSCEYFLSIWERGKLLENVDYYLFDKYKQSSEDTVLSLLPKDLSACYLRNEYRQVLRICFIVLKRDPLNEQALEYCMRSYKKLNDIESLSKIYSAFIIEYRKSMGEDYTKSISDLLQEEK